MIAIAFVHNVLRRHPSCNVLLHKPEAAAATAPATSAAQASNGVAAVANGSADAVTAAQNGHEERDSGAVSLSNGHLGDQHRRAPDEQRLDDAAVQASGQDPYQFAEEDPAESRAIESSLWELDSLRNHYCPQVCTLFWGCFYLHVPRKQIALTFKSMKCERRYLCPVDTCLNNIVLVRRRSIKSYFYVACTVPWWPQFFSQLSHVLLPQVAAFAAVLDKDLTDRKKTAEVDLAPFLTGSYASLVSAELARRLKQVPVAFYPSKLTGLMDPDKCTIDFVGWAMQTQ